MRAYLRSFGEETRGLLRELVGDRSYAGVVLVVLLLPLIFVCDVIVQLVDVGPD